MFRAGLALAILCCGIATGAAPSYSSANIVNAAAFTPGPFAPNSILALFGSNLTACPDGASDCSYSVTTQDIQNNNGALPSNLNGTQVFVGSSVGSSGPTHRAPLFYVSPKQINFVLPANLCSSLPCSVAVRVSTNSNSGPIVSFDMVAAAPALFLYSNYPGFAIATHGDSTNVVTPDSPAHAGEIAVIYLIGLGKTIVDPLPGELPNYTSLIAGLADLRVTLGDITIDPKTACPSPNGLPNILPWPCIEYAGLTPLQAGLYQINLLLPSGIGSNPPIRISIGDQSSPSGVQLAVQ